MNKYQQTLPQIREKATLHWSKEMLSKADSHSALPVLLETQDEFISILTLATKSPTSWEIILHESEKLTPSIFLKHLMVLADLGGEALNKLTPLSQYFTTNSLSIKLNEQESNYHFTEIYNKCSLTNSALRVDSKSVVKNKDLTDRMRDVIMLLLFGALDCKNSLPQEAQEKCNIGTLLGKKDEIEQFVKQNYIKVSKQLSGEKANSLGHASQDYVSKVLLEELQDNWQVKQESTLTGVRHTDEGGNLTNFDLVTISPTGKEFGIEVSFQVTTNSTIERKAREAKSVREKANQAGHYICYVIDGAGNINVRTKAITTICENSDCTVSMALQDLKLLASFMLEKEG